MADILALGIVGSRIVGLDAEDEILRERCGETAAQLVRLAGLVARGELEHIDREITRFQEHGRKLLLAFDLLEREGTREGRSRSVARTLRRSAGLPERSRGKGGMVAARLVAAVHVSLTPAARYRVQPQQADVLTLQDQRHQQAKDAGSVSRSHRSHCLNCSCP